MKGQWFYEGSDGALTPADEKAQRLIAVAPDLLNVARLALSFCETCLPEVQPRLLTVALREIIAKAEGR